MRLSVEEVYELHIRGRKYVTICTLYINGRQVSFGQSKVDGEENYNPEMGKKLALAMAFRFYVKTQCDSIQTDKTGSPIFEDDSIYQENDSDG